VDTDVLPHEGVSNPGVPQGACFRSIRGPRHRPCEVRAGGKQLICPRHEPRRKASGSGS